MSTANHPKTSKVAPGTTQSSQQGQGKGSRVSRRPRAISFVLAAFLKACETRIEPFSEKLLQAVYNYLSLLTVMQRENFTLKRASRIALLEKTLERDCQIRLKSE
jgi:hypothetical protein